MTGFDQGDSVTGQQLLSVLSICLSVCCIATTAGALVALGMGLRFLVGVMRGEYDEPVKTKESKP
jgi:hypothetical protein